MTGDDLPDGDHVVRYAKPSFVHPDGSLAVGAFRLRPDESGLSVHWLEGVDEVGDTATRVAEVRRLSRLTLRPGGRFAELGVGDAKRQVREHLGTLRFAHMPLDAGGGYPADPSHSEVQGLPPDDSPLADFIGDLLVECVRAVHPAR